MRALLDTVGVAAFFAPAVLGDGAALEDAAEGGAWH